MSGVHGPPFPPANLATRTIQTWTLAKGTVVHRIHSARYGAVFFDNGTGGRLNAPNGTYGTCYIAAGYLGAFAEALLRTPGVQILDPALIYSKAYAEIEVVRDLKLVSMDGANLARLGATAEVTHGSLPYTCPQAWSAAIHALTAGFDGILYTSRHDPSQVCYALFDRKPDDLIIRMAVRTLINDSRFYQALDRYDIGLTA